ncbi:MAG TPA: SpoIIE family protein phosphatase [Bryobacteraceae bacterium]|nr:SpoIIE family protein phosphatase [Bryobacteraceae bacterium]
MQATGQAGNRFRERSDLLDFLLEVSAATTQTLDLDALLANLSEIINRVIPYELFCILLFHEKRQDLRIRYALGHREELVRNLSLGLGEGITGTAAALREPVVVSDVRTDPRYLNAVDAVRSELAVPMIVRQRLVGVIDLQSTRPDAFTDYDANLVRLIAARVGTAIDNARLYRRVERQNRTLKTLANISHEFSSILKLDELLAKIASTVRKLIAYDAFSILLVDEHTKALRHRFSSRYDQRVKIDNIPLGKGLTGAAAELREPVRVNDTLADPRYIASHADIRSEVAVPLIAQDRVVGVLDLESDHMGFFTDDHVRTLALLAPQIANSVENARLYEELAARERRIKGDLRAARELQRVLMPARAPEIEGLDIATGYRPAREISGDIFDFLEHKDPNHLVLAFGDVSGKGAAAALYGALVSGLLRTLAPQWPRPADLMRALNEVLIERKVEARYVTLLLVLWQRHSHQLTLANAGAIPPMICRGGEILKVRAEGVPLGLLDSREYEESTFNARSGDVLVFYSDGITDHVDVEGREYGRTRLAEVVRQNCELPAAGIVSAIFADLDRVNPTLFDDQTVLVIRIQ